MVQLDHDEEFVPMHGIYGMLDAVLQVQRTTERVELAAFLASFRTAVSLTVVHVDNKGFIDGLWRGERKCIGPKAKDVDLSIEVLDEFNKWRSKRYIDRG